MSNQIDINNVPGPVAMAKQRVDALRIELLRERWTRIIFCAVALLIVWGGVFVIKHTELAIAIPCVFVVFLVTIFGLAINCGFEIKIEDIKKELGLAKDNLKLVCEQEVARLDAEEYVFED